MVRPPSYDNNGMKKDAWSEDEDNKLRAYIMRYGHWNWRLLPKYAGLARCGKSCRLRWVNYLKPGVKRGNFTKHEKDLIVELHAQLGNKWSAIAAKLPGRTDNDIKNYWHAHIDKRGKHTTRVVERNIDNRVFLEGEKPSDSIFWETNVNELASFETLPKLLDPTLPFDTYLAYPNQTDYIPPLSEEGFFYSDYRHLPNLDPSYNWGDLTISTSDYIVQSWSEPFMPYDSNSLRGFNDHCLPYFDHGMTLL